MRDDRGQRINFRRKDRLPDLAPDLFSLICNGEFVRLTPRYRIVALAAFLGRAIAVLLVVTLPFGLVKLAPGFTSSNARWLWPTLIVFIAVVFLVPSGFWRFSRRAAAVSTLIGKSCCGACGFGLADELPETDGCVICPECGAAWRPSAVT